MTYFPLPPKVAATIALQTSRRGFLVGASALGASLVIGFRPLGARAEPAAAGNPFAAYIQIDPDSKVTIYSSQFEMGQGAYFGIATLVNEELAANWADIAVEGASGNVALYGNLAWGGAAQGTGGSTSMSSSFDRYRIAGATARTMLQQAAADAWGVPVSEVTVANGILSHPSGRTARFGEMATAAAALDVPADVPLKPREAWTQIGSDALRRYDTPAKTTGRKEFTADLFLPQMVTAVMIHPPLFGATVASFDASEAKAMPGVVDVVATPRGVAVVADRMWTALKARDLVRVEWDESAAEKRGSTEILADYVQTAAGPGAASARKEGDAEAALAGAARVIEATFEFPYLAHAAIEPLNAVVRKDGDVIEVWGGHQMPDLYQYVVAQIAETTPDKVRLHVMPTGGGFGRRAVFDGDVIAEATAVARSLGWKYPVKVQWTRGNDMAGGRYRPAYAHRIRAGLDAEGNLLAWNSHIVGQSILKGTAFEGMITNGIDMTSVEGASNIPYSIPNLTVDLTTKEVGVPVLWWRAVGSTHTAYAVEAFIDELATAAGQDPVAFRLAMLRDNPRHAAVLQLAADKSGWSEPLAAGRFRGIALAEAFSTIVAQVVEISLAEGGAIKVERVVAAVDCGTVINPDQVRAQVEGAIGFGLGSILQEELTLTGGQVDQTNYDGYMPLRIDQMPVVEVHTVASTAHPTGIGEPGVPPVGPALANAVFAATGKRIRILPFSKGMSV